MSTQNPQGEPWWGNSTPLQTYGTQLKSDTQQILEAIAALADGLRARDAQLTAISEQVRQGFEKDLNVTVVAPSEITKAIEQRLAAIEQTQQGTSTNWGALHRRLGQIETVLAQLLARRAAGKRKRGKR